MREKSKQRWNRGEGLMRPTNHSVCLWRNKDPASVNAASAPTPRCGIGCLRRLPLGCQKTATHPALTGSAGIPVLPGTSRTGGIRSHTPLAGGVRSDHPHNTQGVRSDHPHNTQDVRSDHPHNTEGVRSDRPHNTQDVRSDHPHNTQDVRSDKPHTTRDVRSDHPHTI